MLFDHGTTKSPLLQSASGFLSVSSSPTHTHSSEHQKSIDAIRECFDMLIQLVLKFKWEPLNHGRSILDRYSQMTVCVWDKNNPVWCNWLTPIISLNPQGCWVFVPVSFTMMHFLHIFQSHTHTCYIHTSIMSVSKAHSTKRQFKWKFALQLNICLLLFKTTM